MRFDQIVTVNKSIEMEMFTGGWPCMFDMHADWTLKNQGVDHWGFKFYLVLFGYKIIEFNFYDIRHGEDEEIG